MECPQVDTGMGTQKTRGLDSHRRQEAENFSDSAEFLTC